jgi:hypothetical protein
MANATPALNPNPPKLVTGVQIKAARALLSAGVVTVSTPAPGVCLLSAGPRRIGKPAASPVPMASDQEGDGHPFITANKGSELCTMHNDLAGSAAQDRVDSSTAPDCEPDTAVSEAGT